MQVVLISSIFVVMVKKKANISDAYFVGQENYRDDYRANRHYSKHLQMCNDFDDKVKNYQLRPISVKQEQRKNKVFLNMLNYGMKNKARSELCEQNWIV